MLQKSAHDSLRITSGKVAIGIASGVMEDVLYNVLYEPEIK